MSNLLEGKTAIVTGGSSGIGRAIALKMAENGANLAIIYYPGFEADAVNVCDEAVEINSAGGTAKPYCCDVSNFDNCGETVKQIIADFSGVDILVNNAGITRDALLLSMSENDFDSVISVNLKGAFNMIKPLYSQFMKKRSGRIINISSISGMMGNPGQANYSSAKAGIIGLTKTVAKELAGRSVTCNAIAPGFIETEMTKKLSDRVTEAAIAQIPLKRMGKPDDIAELAVFLASDKAAYITGEIIKIDGGMYI
jgi:3-oxoacyl-[acyl-carrier protein] reductase